MDKAVQAKHIEDRAVLAVVRQRRTEPTDYWPLEPGKTRWVMFTELCEALPAFPPKVLRAKAAALIRRGLMSGCTCGCRGDFELTDKGEAAI